MQRTVSLREIPRSGTKPNMFYVYFLRSLKNNDLYIGSTENVRERLFLHNAGKVKSTKAYRPWELLECREFKTRSEAVNQERFFKNHQQKDLIKKRYNLTWIRPGGEVANALVCKTNIRGFNSLPGLMRQESVPLRGIQRSGTNFLYVGANLTGASSLTRLCRGGGMVYTSDLKSLEIFLMWVRLPPAAQMYKAYILQSLKDLRTYTGYTKNINIRLDEHNLGKVSATCYRRPFKILYTEEVNSLKEAKLREKYWKNGAGRRKLAKFFKNGFPPIKIWWARLAQANLGRWIPPRVQVSYVVLFKTQEREDLHGSWRSHWSW